MVMLKRLFYEESGQGMVEYGLIIALVAVAVIALLSALGGSIGEVFTKVSDKLDESIVD